MLQWKVIFATLLIFGSGVFAGSLLIKSPRLAKPNEKSEPKRPMPWEGPARAESLKRLEKDLKLTPEQSEKIGAILAEGHKRSRSVAEPLLAKMREDGQKVREQIRAELTPHQVKRFDVLPPARGSRDFPSRGGTNATNFFKKFPKEKRPSSATNALPSGEVKPGPRPEPSPKKD